METSDRKVDEVDLARAWIEWLVDTRAGYLETFLKLPPEERRKDRGASFRSMEDIFLHILDDNVWWFASVPQGLQETHHKVDSPLSDAEIRGVVGKVAKTSTELARSLTTDRLNQKYTIRGVQGNGKPFVMTMNLRTIIWHMVEEELQHRGELNALFWQMDVDAPTRAWFSSSLAE